MAEEAEGEAFAAAAASSGLLLASLSQLVRHCSRALQQLAGNALGRSVEASMVKQQQS